MDSPQLPWDHNLPFDAEDLELTVICINGLWDENRDRLVHGQLLPVLQEHYPEMSVHPGMPRNATGTLFLNFQTERDGKLAREVLINHPWEGSPAWVSRIGFKLRQ